MTTNVEFNIASVIDSVMIIFMNLENPLMPKPLKIGNRNIDNPPPMSTSLIKKTVRNSMCS